MAVGWSGAQGSLCANAPLIMAALPEELVDHINHDSLDNRRCNLRLCNSQQNAVNRKVHRDSASRYKGIYLSRSGKWVVDIRGNGKRVRGGTFSDEVEAAKAADRLIKELHGDFAYPNFRNV